MCESGKYYDYRTGYWAGKRKDMDPFIYNKIKDPLVKELRK